MEMILLMSLTTAIVSAMLLLVIVLMVVDSDDDVKVPWGIKMMICTFSGLLFLSIGSAVVFTVLAAS